TGDQVDSCPRPSIDSDTSPTTSSEDHCEYDTVARTRTIDCFGKREAVRVVHAPHLAVESAAQISVQRVAVQCVRVGVFDAPRSSRDGAGDADADSPGLTQCRFRFRDQFGNSGNDGFVAAGVSIDPFPVDFGPTFIECDDLCFRSPQIDPESHRYTLHY